MSVLNHDGNILDTRMHKDALESDRLVLALDLLAIADLVPVTVDTVLETVTLVGFNPDGIDLTNTREFALDQSPLELIKDAWNRLDNLKNNNVLNGYHRDVMQGLMEIHGILEP